MSQNSVGLSVLRENTAFPFFFYPIYATLLLEAWALEMRASAVPHMIIALPFVAFASAGYLRYQRYIAAKTKSPVIERQQPAKTVGILDLVRFPVMLTTGYVFGQLILLGYMTPMSILAIGLQFLPWSRICATRLDFFVCGGLAAIGTTLALVVTAEPFGSLFSLPQAAAVLWAGALVAYLRRC